MGLPLNGIISDRGKASSCYDGLPLSELVKSAERGDSIALNKLEELCGSNNSDAQIALGRMYESGCVENKNAKDAMELYLRAAELNNVEAQFMLGFRYLLGVDMHDLKIVEPNDEKAAMWFQRAAQNGHAMAQCNLGTMYEKGQGGLSQNEKEAQIWFEKAAAQGLVEAQFNLGVIYNKYSNNTTEPTLKQDYAKKAFECYLAAAKQGFAYAQFNVGVMYLNNGDYEKAAQWFTKAAKQGLAKAQYNLAVLYAEGRVADASDEKAIQWFTQAAEQGLFKAMFTLGRMLLQRGNNEEAAKWLKKAAEYNIITRGTQL